LGGSGAKGGLMLDLRDEAAVLETRARDPTIRHLAFLWKDYHPGTDLVVSLLLVTAVVVPCRQNTILVVVFVDAAAAAAAAAAAVVAVFVVAVVAVSIFVETRIALLTEQFLI
jgi:hypothetical protein